MPGRKIPVKEWPVVILATGLGSGFSPVAPGTAGSVVGVAIYCLINGWHWSAYLLVTILVTLVGIPVSSRAEKIFGETDSGKIVIDEIAGQLIALFMVPFTPLAVVAGFLLFRLFDIWKPLIRKVEKLPGGVGVMLDDVLAGLFALVVLQSVIFLV